MDQREQNQWKQAAAEAAAEPRRRRHGGWTRDRLDGGIFRSSARAAHLSRGLARIRPADLRNRPRSQARGLGIPLTSFAEHAQIDIAVDGADEVEIGTLYLIKGRGGALLREKIVAAASKRMIVIADETKLVERLGSIVSVPVEVVQFGWQATETKAGQLGGNPSLRVGRDSPALT